MTARKHYELSSLKIVEIEILNSQQLADMKGRGTAKKWSTKPNIAFVHHIESDSGYANHSYKGYDHWVTTMNIKDHKKRHVLKTPVSTVAVRLLKWCMR